jgi:hypothetical protein
MGASRWFDEKDGIGAINAAQAVIAAAVLQKGCVFTFDLLVAVCLATRGQIKE